MGIIEGDWGGDGHVLIGQFVGVALNSLGDPGEGIKPVLHGRNKLYCLQGRGLDQKFTVYQQLFIRFTNRYENHDTTKLYLSHVIVLLCSLSCSGVTDNGVIVLAKALQNNKSLEGLK